MFHPLFKIGSKSSSGGFAIGLILMVIVLMAALATMMSATSISLRIDREVQEVDIVRFTDQARKVARSIDRIVKTNCEDTNAAFTACIDGISNALAQATPCEQDANNAVQRYCPYHPLYGGAVRTQLPSGILAAGAKEKWLLFKQVVPPNASWQDTNFAVLVMDDLTADFCLALEKRLTNNRNTTLVTAAPLSRDEEYNSLPLARREACFSYVDSEQKYMYYLLVSSFREDKN